MADFSQVYRAEPQFKETVTIISAEHLVVRQLSETAFIITVSDPATKTEYVLSKARTRDVKRTFTNLGRCVQFAVRMFGLRAIHFELLDEPLSDENGE